MPSRVEQSASKKPLLFYNWPTVQKLKCEEKLEKKNKILNFEIF
jgi:hypothetical protein